MLHFINGHKFISPRLTNSFFSLRHTTKKSDTVISEKTNNKNLHTLTVYALPFLICYPKQSRGFPHKHTFHTCRHRREQITNHQPPKKNYQLISGGFALVLISEGFHQSHHSHQNLHKFRVNVMCISVSVCERAGKNGNSFITQPHLLTLSLCLCDRHTTWEY